MGLVLVCKNIGQGSQSGRNGSTRVSGSDIHVMLAKRFRVTVGQSRFPTERRSTESHGYPQSVSTVHVIQVQEKWSHS
jgi:hypothetical protein